MGSRREVREKRGEGEKNKGEGEKKRREGERKSGEVEKERDKQTCSFLVHSLNNHNILAGQG